MIFNVHTREEEKAVGKGELKEHFCPEGLFRPFGINVTVLRAGETGFCGVYTVVGMYIYIYIYRTREYKRKIPERRRIRVLNRYTACI